MKKIKVLLDCLPDAPFKATLAAEVQAQHDYTRAVIAERDALRKAAQMALKALEQAECGLSIGYGLTRVRVMDVIEALRKELGHG